MNRAALDYLKNLQQTISNLAEEQEYKLNDVGCENFIDDVNENVLSKLDDIIYEIETIMGDVEEGYYTSTDFNDNEDEDNFDNF